jgi:hypothetical protein
MQPVCRGQHSSCMATPAPNILHLLLVLQVFLWDVASGGVIRKFRGHDSRINAVSAMCMVCGMPAKQCAVSCPEHALASRSMRHTLWLCFLDSKAIRHLVLPSVVWNSNHFADAEPMIFAACICVMLSGVSCCV